MHADSHSGGYKEEERRRTMKHCQESACLSDGRVENKAKSNAVVDYAQLHSWPKPRILALVMPRDLFCSAFCPLFFFFFLPAPPCYNRVHGCSRLCRVAGNLRLRGVTVFAPALHSCRGVESAAASVALRSVGRASRDGMGSIPDWFYTEQCCTVRPLHSLPGPQEDTKSVL